jgi:hypothetical protein
MARLYYLHVAGWRPCLVFKHRPIYIVVCSSVTSLHVHQFELLFYICRSVLGTTRNTYNFCSIVFQDIVRSSTWTGLPVNERRNIVWQVLNSRATRTIKKYLGACQSYKLFLADTGHSTSLPTQSILISTYLSYICEHKSSYNPVLLVFCAIKWVNSLFPMNTDVYPADTQVSHNVVEGSKILFCSKKEPLPFEVVRRVCQTFAVQRQPFWILELG